VPAEKLVLERRLSKSLGEYASLSHQAIAAQQLGREGRYIHAGQNIRYIVTADRAAIKDNRAVPSELFEEEINHDTEAYVKLLVTSFVNLFLPLGYDTSRVREILQI
jgi:DNA polymerase elongation subunit (family B)